MKGRREGNRWVGPPHPAEVLLVVLLGVGLLWAFLRFGPWGT